MSKWIVAILLFPVLVFAGAKPTLQSVLEKTQRPTMSEVQGIVSELNPEQLEPIAREEEVRYRNNHGADGLNFNLWFGILSRSVPRLVAHLERAFPGATFAFLGRDTLSFADVFESFYASLGQYGRVVRLEASSGSFHGATEDLLAGFMRSNGFDARDVGDMHPYVIVDTVASGDGRQPRRLVHAIYNEYIKFGGDPADLVPYINTVGLKLLDGYTKSSIADAADILTSQEEKYRSLWRRKMLNVSSEHLMLHYVASSDSSLMGPQNRGPNWAGYDFYVGAWHESFEPFKADHTGRVFAAPGRATSREMRLSVLNHQRKILEMTNSPEFLRQVQAEANAIGFEYPLTRTQPLKRDVISICQTAFAGSDIY